LRIILWLPNVLHSGFERLLKSPSAFVRSTYNRGMVPDVPRRRIREEAEPIEEGPIWVAMDRLEIAEDDVRSLETYCSTPRLRLYPVCA